MADVIDVTTDPTTYTAALGSTVPLDYTPADGRNRIVLIAINLTPSDDVTNLLVLNDGVSIDTPASFNAAAGEGAVTVVGIAVDDDHTGPLPIELQINGVGGSVNYRVQYFTVSGVNPEDAALTTASFSSGTPENPMSGSMDVPEIGGISFAVGAWFSGSSAIEPLFTPDELEDGRQEAPIIDSDGAIAGLVLAYSDQLTGTVAFTFGHDTEPLSPYGLASFVLRAVECADITGFNCTPYPDSDNLTLAEYRQKLLIRAGFAAVASNPPPGTAALFNSFLQDAQDLLYKKYPALETRWFFRWTMEENVRFYGIRSDDGLQGDCSLILDPYKNIEGAWLVDLNGAWLPMTFGIPPSFYTTVIQPGLPVRLEIRQCIEVFPAPSADGYQLMIKGHFGKQAFTQDADKPTIDGHLVYLWALADALAYYGKPGAVAAAATAQDYLGQVVSGTHTGKRYVPGERPLPPAIMPMMAPTPDP